MLALNPLGSLNSAQSIQHRTSPERVWFAESPRWSYSTYPPSFQSELLYTDSEKRPEQTHNYRTPFRPPQPQASEFVAYQDPSRPPTRWGLISLVPPRTQSSRLAKFGGLGMSFNICRGTDGDHFVL
jgi:hypothetical protein